MTTTLMLRPCFLFVNPFSININNCCFRTLYKFSHFLMLVPTIRASANTSCANLVKSRFFHSFSSNKLLLMFHFPAFLFYSYLAITTWSCGRCALKCQMVIIICRLKYILEKWAINLFLNLKTWNKNVLWMH